MKGDEISEQIEDWIRMRQYIDLLPFEYDYSFECDYDQTSQDFESQIFIRVGGISWQGRGYGYTEFSSLAESLRHLEVVASLRPSVECLGLSSR